MSIPIEGSKNGEIGLDPYSFKRGLVESIRGYFNQVRGISRSVYEDMSDPISNLAGAYGTQTRIQYVRSNVKNKSKLIRDILEIIDNCADKLIEEEQKI